MCPVVAFGAAGAGANVGADADAGADADVNVSVSNDDGKNGGAGSLGVALPEGSLPRWTAGEWTSE